MTRSAIRPPWVEYPGYPPGDPFWRQSGEAWFQHVWLDYWRSLSPADQSTYLDRWDVPDSWRMLYFDHEFRCWLDQIDD